MFYQSPDLAYRAMSWSLCYHPVANRSWKSTLLNQLVDGKKWGDDGWRALYCACSQIWYMIHTVEQYPSSTCTVMIDIPRLILRHSKIFQGVKGKRKNVAAAVPSQDSRCRQRFCPSSCAGWAPEMSFLLVEHSTSGSSFCFAVFVQLCPSLFRLRAPWKRSLSHAGTRGKYFSSSAVLLLYRLYGTCFGPIVLAISSSCPQVPRELLLRGH